MTPYYDNGRGIVLYHGDALDALPSLPPSSVVICDPPYGRKAYATDAPLPPAFFGSLLAHCRTVALFGYPEDLAGLTVEIGRKPDEWVTWWPTNKIGGRALARLPKETEHVAIWGETPGAALLMRPRNQSGIGLRISETRGLSRTDARMGDVWRDAAPGMAFNYKQRLHPNEKPLTLLRRLVVLCSRPGDVILDPTAGSGTALVAALLEGRSAIGVELSEAYCEIAAKRLEQMPLPLEMAI